MRAQLGRFGFSRDRADLKVGVLSGGEKTRLLLSLATRNAPHLLLLDEPTNHLDMDARASLVDAINDFEGAVVLVSHDTHLVKMVADQLWLVADGKVTPFDGDIDDYQAKLLRERNGGKNGKASKRERARERERERRTPAPVPAAKKDQRKQSADSRAKRAPLKKTLETLEKSIAKLNKQRGDIEARLADPAIYSDPGDQRRRSAAREGPAGARDRPRRARVAGGAGSLRSGVSAFIGSAAATRQRAARRSQPRDDVGRGLANDQHQRRIDDVEADGDPEDDAREAGGHQEAEHRRRQERADIEAGIDEAEDLARGAGRRGVAHDHVARRIGDAAGRAGQRQQRQQQRRRDGLGGDRHGQSAPATSRPSVATRSWRRTRSAKKPPTSTPPAEPTMKTIRQSAA